MDTSEESLPTATLQPVQQEDSPPSPDQKDPYNTLRVRALISKSKFSVFVATLPSSPAIHAIKVFPYQGELPHDSYLNERPAQDFDHKNIVKISQIRDRKVAISKGQYVNSSYILMELAPYGDLNDFINSSKFTHDTKLARTYFKQLISGIKHIHQTGYAHLDLKLENLLLGQGYVLKICDFDLMRGIDSIDNGQKVGTKNFRAPEVRAGAVVSNSAADVYAAGIILFCLSYGIMPHYEDDIFYEMRMNGNKNKFWKVHPSFYQKGGQEPTKEFIELFEMMTDADPKKRAKISEIEESQWYNGSVYSSGELIFEMSQKVQNKYKVFN